MLFERALPGIVFQPLKQVHTVAAESMAPVINRPPDTVAVFRLVEKHLPVEAFELIGRIDIEHKKPARTKAFINAAECFLHILRLCNIVDAVERAHTGIDRLRQTKPLHRLRNKKGLVFLQLHRLFRCHGQHVLRPVDPEHRIAALRQQHRQRSCAAGEIQHGFRLYTVLLQKAFEKAQIFFIRNVARQSVVGRCKRLIAAHGVCSCSSSSLMRAKIMR